MAGWTVLQASPARARCCSTMTAARRLQLVDYYRETYRRPNRTGRASGSAADRRRHRAHGRETWCGPAGLTSPAARSRGRRRRAAADHGPRPRAATVVPGFADTHLHGGGAANFSGSAPRRRRPPRPRLHRTARHHHADRLAGHRRGPEDLLRQVAGTWPTTSGPALLDGIHLEGPWLSTRCGAAHQPLLMRNPDPAEIDRILEAADGAVRMVTLAPERDGALRGDRATHRRRSGGRHRTHRSQLRADPVGDRRGRDGRHPPVQRDAPDRPSRAGPGHRPARRTPRVTWS